MNKSPRYIAKQTSSYEISITCVICKNLPKDLLACPECEAIMCKLCIDTTNP